MKKEIEKKLEESKKTRDVLVEELKKAEQIQRQVFQLNVQIATYEDLLKEE